MIEVAKLLFENIESILHWASYSFENAYTLDFDFDIETINKETNYEHNDDDNSYDDDYNVEHEKENIVPNQFSFDYMKNAVQFYDEKDERTGKRKQSFSNVQCHVKK